MQDENATCTGFELATIQRAAMPITVRQGVSTQVLGTPFQFCNTRSGGLSRPSW